MRSKFSLIDLVSQRDAVRSHLRGVDTATKLEWIVSKGSIRMLDVPPGFRTTYVFQSHFGATAAFFFADDGDFIFVGDHHTYR